MSDEPTYYQKNRDRCLTQAKEYLEQHREEYKAYHREYYQKNKHQMNAKRREWQRKNREKTRVVFYERKPEEVVKKILMQPIVLSPVEEMPRWSMVISEGCTLTFE